ncbi:hypothetical protein T492DRAFT_972339, partial [Pavlovales sp. CCMP2436]
MSELTRRWRATPPQKRLLEHVFAADPSPLPATCITLAMQVSTRDLSVTPKQIRIWFQNHRLRIKNRRVPTRLVPLVVAQPLPQPSPASPPLSLMAGLTLATGAATTSSPRSLEMLSATYLPRMASCRASSASPADKRSVAMTSPSSSSISTARVAPSTLTRVTPPAG